MNTDAIDNNWIYTIVDRRYIIGSKMLEKI